MVVPIFKKGDQSVCPSDRGMGLVYWDEERPEPEGGALLRS